MGRVSRSHKKYLFISAINTFSCFIRLKSTARRSHLGPTGKKKAGAQQKKSMQRREIMFESTGAIITTRGVPLVLAQSNETVRKQTLDWVSPRQLLLILQWLISFNSRLLSSRSCIPAIAALVVQLPCQLEYAQMRMVDNTRL